MVEIHKITGRLSNLMFLTAAHYARSRREGTHFFAQDEKYFEDYKDEIKAIFSEGIVPNSIDRVAIHRRLTDYVGNSFYVDLGHHAHQKLEDNYFMRAMREFPEGTKFLVFSDDIETAKKEPMFHEKPGEPGEPGEQFEFSEGKSAVEDMNLMASCKGLIGSNSSFSWWAAWLGETPDKKIIFPAKWFSDPNHEQFIGVPKRWIRM